jgi:carbonic anhydrase
MLHKQLEAELLEQEAWALRRQRAIPNNRRLWVLACMDEIGRGVYQWRLP